MLLGTRIVRMSVIAALAVGLQSQHAGAQLFWDWGGGDEVGDSGREIVYASTRTSNRAILSSALATGGFISSSAR